MSSRLDLFKAAVALSVEGDSVTLASIKGPAGEEFHVTPRKFSKKHAAKIRKLLTETAAGVSPSVQSKIMRLRKDHGGELSQEDLAGALSDEDMASLLTVGDPELLLKVESAKLLYGIAEHDLGDAPGPMTPEIVELILESRDVAEEVLAAVDAMNPPFGDQTSS